MRVAALFKEFGIFLQAFWNERELLKDLTQRDFKTNYLGSLLSFLWAFVHPFVTIAILYFIFQVAFPTGPIDKAPYILWLTCGLVPWFFLSESLGTATNVIRNYSYLVKKIVFRVSLLPIVKIISSLFIHVFFIGIIAGIMIAFDWEFSIYNIQIIYYLFCAIVLSVGLSWLTSSTSLFLRDIPQIVTVAIQLGFWLSPIIWNYNNIPAKYHLLLKLNPVFYIVQGYRESIIQHVWFWEHPVYSAYFWFVTLTAFVLGALAFLRLRPHFADVL